MKKPGILEKLQLTKHSLWSPWQHRLLWEHHPAAPSFVLATSEDRVTFKVSAPILSTCHGFPLSCWGNAPCCITPPKRCRSKQAVDLEDGVCVCWRQGFPGPQMHFVTPTAVKTTTPAPARSLENSDPQHSPPSTSFLHPPTWVQSTTHPQAHSLAHLQI